MYSVPYPVSTIRTRIRQEFERHRYVSKLPVIDILIFQSHADYQVRRGAIYWWQACRVLVLGMLI